MSIYQCSSDTYRFTDHELVLECRVRGHPTPSISWLKDGKILEGDRYCQNDLGDGVYRLIVTDPDTYDSGKYTCQANNEIRTEEISHMVHFQGNKNAHFPDFIIFWWRKKVRVHPNNSRWAVFFFHFLRNLLSHVGLNSLISKGMTV